MAPTLRTGIGDSCLLRAGDLDVIIDFPNGEVREFAGEDHAFRFDIQRELVETVAAQRAVDWSNALFLSCRFRAWRAGPFNEYLYNFFKSLSPERMRRAEAEARQRSTRNAAIWPARRSASATTSSSACARTARPTSACSARSRAANWSARCTAGASTSRPVAASPPTIAGCGSAEPTTDSRLRPAILPIRVHGKFSVGLKSASATRQTTLDEWLAVIQIDAGQQLDLSIVDAAADVVETLHSRRRGLRGALRRLGNTLGDLGWPLEQLNTWLDALVDPDQALAPRRAAAFDSVAALAEGWAERYVRGAPFGRLHRCRHRSRHADRAAHAAEGDLPALPGVRHRPDRRLSASCRSTPTPTTSPRSSATP